MEKAPTHTNDENEYNKVFNKEEQEKISSLEKLLKARKNVLNDPDSHNTDSNDLNDDDNDGLKEYRGIF